MTSQNPVSREGFAPHASLSEGAGVLPLFTAFFIIGLQLAGILSGSWAWVFLILAFGGILFELFHGVEGGSPYGWLFLGLAAISAGGFTAGMRTAPQIDSAALSAFNDVQGTLSGTFTGECRWKRDGSLVLPVQDLIFDVASQSIAWPGKAVIEVSPRGGVYPKGAMNGTSFSGAAKSDLTPEPGQRYTAPGTMRVIKNRRPRFETTELAQTALQNSFGPFIGRIQRWVRDGTAGLLSIRHQSMMVGFIIGDTSLLQSTDRRLFKETGVTHLLAVSGQHIMVLAILLIAILSWSGVPPLSRGILTITALILFGFVAGGQPSVWRAVVMYATGVIIWNMEASPSPLQPLALSALLLLLFDPQSIHDIGFQLSFMAVLGILLGREPIELPLRRIGIPLLLARYLAVSFAANIATIPLVAYHFHFISLSAFVVNPLIVWTFELILPMGIALAILGHFWFSGGVVVAAALSLLLDAVLTVIEAGGRLPLALVAVPNAPGFLVAAIYGGLLWSSTRIAEGFTAADTACGEGSEAPFDSTRDAIGTQGNLLHSRPPEPNRVRAGKQAVLSSDFSGGEDSASTIGGLRKGFTATSPLLSPFPELSPESLKRLVNPLSDQETVAEIDRRLALVTRRSLKSRGNLEVTTFSLPKLSVDAQTLYHRLDDLTFDTLEKEPERLLQAQIFLLAFLGGEVLTRITPLLTPPVGSADLFTSIRAKARPLNTAVLAERFFSSELSNRAADNLLRDFLSRARVLHCESRLFLAQLITSNPRSVESVVSAHFEQRHRVLAWIKNWLEKGPNA
ncbi:MAG: ComEC/Rec2 family competence protein [Candidatus Ozemobacteraceae bacterium]